MKKQSHKQGTENIKAQTNFLYVISFVEGGAVMAIELAGAKMVAPYYGTSLFVWASVLTVTLSGLASGYFLGGWASTRFNAIKLLFWELLLSVVLVVLMPLIAVHIMPATAGMGLRLGSLFSILSFMFLPLVCMGMMSPTIIQLTSAEKNSGKAAGTIYAISTVGGILMTLLMGFYLLPEFGIRKSVYSITILLGLMPVMLVTFYGMKKILVGAGMFAVIFSLLASKKAFDVPDLPLKFLYKSDGILGQIAVMENPDPFNGNTYHHLFINHIPQTWTDVRFMPVSAWAYPHRLAKAASIKPSGSKALLIGMGGGNLVMEFKQLGFAVDVVELDERIPKVAQKYFAFNPDGVNMHLDDGRHFIRETKNRYDLLVIDVLNGEVQPSHLFTKESFAEMKKILNPDGLIIINNQGYFQGEHGIGSRSIYKTLLASGYKVKYYGGSNHFDDIHFFASPSDFDLNNIKEERINQCCRFMINKEEAPTTAIAVDTASAFTLVDDKPQLEKLNGYTNEEWRSGVISVSGLLKRLEFNNIPFFY